MLRRLVVIVSAVVLVISLTTNASAKDVYLYVNIWDEDHGPIDNLDVRGDFTFDEHPEEDMFDVPFQFLGGGIYLRIIVDAPSYFSSWTPEIWDDIAPIDPDSNPAPSMSPTESSLDWEIDID